MIASRALPASAEVVIIGAGVIGASIAWHLCQRGCSDVVLLDGGEPGSGSTSKATGGFRAQFDTEVNIRLSLLSRAKLLRFHDEVGADPGFEQRGYLWLATEEPELDRLRKAQTLQHATGLTEARMLTGSEARAFQPALDPVAIAGAAYCPTDGFIRPMQILDGYLRDAIRMGARLFPGQQVRSLRRESESIARVECSEGGITAGTVVNAAGSWAGDVGRMAGVDIPVTPRRRCVAVMEPSDLLPEEMPMTIFAEDGFHFRMRDGRLLLLRPGAGDDQLEDSWIDALLETAAKRIPVIRCLRLDRLRCWDGLYEMSPDHHAIVGLAPGTKNFLLANGSSGHGVMHSPAIGQIISEMILDGKSSVDVHALRPSRFAEGALNATPSTI